MVKIGAAFPDFIVSEKPRKFHNFGEKKNQTRDFFLLMCLFIGLIFIVGKLFLIQVLQGDYYRTLSDSNRIKTIIIHAPRGEILDRSGNPLVFNIPGFRKTVDGKTILISKEDAIKLIAGGDKNLEYDSLRQYPYGDIFAHVIGYTGQISEDELKEDKFADYRGGDLVGKMGIEQYYESMLRGTDGKQLVEVDSLGNTIRKLGQTDPIPGQDLTLTLDLNLQKAAFSAMQGVSKGALIVSTPKGEILSMISKPSFDPNLFTLPLNYQKSTDSAKKLEEVLLDPVGKPLLNRAISGTYPPGSTFKLIVAAAGLQDKIIDENWEVQDTGIINVGAFSFSNWYFSQYGKTEGLVNVVKGIKRSNDIFFYKLAETVGVDKISQMAAKFGLGKILGIDLFGEAKGVLPTQEWKQKEIGEPWYLGDTYHYGIGQGFLLTTPLQVNAWTQAIANGGTLYKPHLLKDLGDKVLNENFLDQKNSDLIRQGMIEACSTGGVAWPLFEFRVKNPKLKIDGKNFLAVPESTTSAQFADYRKVTVACKTGTAQHGDQNTQPHAWITLFAPAYDPQIVVTVLSESSGEGSNVAAPIAKKVLEEWFTR